MSISTHTPTPVCRMNPTTIMTATHATPPTLESKIKRWVELDNKIKETAEEVRDVRTEKAVINDEILELNVRTEVELTPEVVEVLQRENLV